MKIPNEIKSFSHEELSQKLLDRIISHQDIKDLIGTYNTIHPYPFERSLLFKLGQSMVKHSSPIDIISWKAGIKERGIINANDKEETAVDTLNIINEYLNAESRLAMKRIMVYSDVEFEGKVLKNVTCYDYSLIDPHGQFESYESLLFVIENHASLISYYLDYIYYFPVTLDEFEKFFFYFLTFLTHEKYPANDQINESLKFVKDMNEIVEMRYIDINDRLILAFIHLISTESELSECCNSIYKDIKHNDDLIRKQFANMAS